MSAAIKAARARYQGDAGYPRAMPGTGYAGDPGLFGSIFGRLKGLVGKSPIGGLVTGLAGGLISRIGRKNPRQIGTRRGRAPFPGFGGGCPPGTRAHFRTGECSPTEFARLGPGPRTPQFPLPGLLAMGQRAIVGGATGMGGGEMVPQGYHLNKSGYFRGGRPKSDFPNVEWVAPRTVAVRNRKRNALNPRAADRAIGRITSAKKFAAKLGRITIRKEC